MWDVDGTLLLTGGAGQDALIDVIKDYYHIDAFAFANSLAGRTDAEIVKGAVKQIRGCYVCMECANILMRYEMALSRYLPTHEGRIMKNVVATLKYLQQQPESFHNCLLTGNTDRGAMQKLRYYDLAQYFDFNDSCFGNLAEERADLARLLWQRLCYKYPEVKIEDIIFIGDTENDALCAQAIGAKCLIVLEGSSRKREDFVSCSPWKVIDALPDNPEDFVRLLESEE